MYFYGNNSQKLFWIKQDVFYRFLDAEKNNITSQISSVR